MRKVFLSLVLTIVIVTAIFVWSRYADVLSELTDAAITQTPTAIPTSVPICPDYELNEYVYPLLERAEESIQQNQVIVDHLKTNCMGLREAKYMDVTGDGVDEIILNSSYAGCGSCHFHMISIFQENKLLFEFGDEDFSMFEKAPSGKGFVIRNPKRQDFFEPLCCPSEYRITTYNYINGTFDITKTEIVTAESQGFR